MVQLRVVRRWQQVGRRGAVDEAPDEMERVYSQQEGMEEGPIGHHGDMRRGSSSIRDKPLRPPPVILGLSVGSEESLEGEEGDGGVVEDVMGRKIQEACDALELAVTIAVARYMCVSMMEESVRRLLYGQRSVPQRWRRHWRIRLLMVCRCPRSWW